MRISNTHQPIWRTGVPTPRLNLSGACYILPVDRHNSPSSGHSTIAKFQRKSPHFQRRHSLHSRVAVKRNAARGAETQHPRDTEWPKIAGFDQSSGPQQGVLSPESRSVEFGKAVRKPTGARIQEWPCHSSAITAVSRDWQRDWRVIERRMDVEPWRHSEETLSRHRPDAVSDGQSG